MHELGQWSQQLHRQLGEEVARRQVDFLVAVQGDARYLLEGAVEAGLPRDRAAFFENPEEAGSWVADLVKPGDAVLFKGSRATRMELAFYKLKQKLEEKTSRSYTG